MHSEMEKWFERRLKQIRPARNRCNRTALTRSGRLCPSLSLEKHRALRRSTIWKVPPRSGRPTTTLMNCWIIFSLNGRLVVGGISNSHGQGDRAYEDPEAHPVQPGARRYGFRFPPRHLLERRTLWRLCHSCPSVPALVRSFLRKGFVRESVMLHGQQYDWIVLRFPKFFFHVTDRVAELATRSVSQYSNSSDGTTITPASM